LEYLGSAKKRYQKCLSTLDDKQLQEFVVDVVVSDAMLSANR